MGEIAELRLIDLDQYVTCIPFRQLDDQVSGMQYQAKFYYGHIPDHSIMKTKMLFSIFLSLGKSEWLIMLETYDNRSNRDPPHTDFISVL